MLAVIKNFLRGIKQTIPSNKLLPAVKKSNDLQANLVQTIYYNLFYYLLPVLLYFLVLTPLLDLGKLYFDLNSIELAISWAYPLYLLNIIPELLVYNTLFTATTAKLYAINNKDLEDALEDTLEEKKLLCDCSQAEKLKQSVRSPVYYLSNHIFAFGIDKLLHPILAKLLKMSIYGRALTESYIDNADMCVEHKKQWVTKRNALCLGIGASFVLSNTLIMQLINNSINFISPTTFANLDVLSSFIISDTVFNLLWFTYIATIHTNPSILLISSDYTLDLYKYNNNIALNVFNNIKEKVKTKLLESSSQPNVLAKISKAYNNYKIHSILYYLLPRPLRSPKEFINAAPVQLFLYVNRDSLLEANRWLGTVNKSRAIIVGSEILGAKHILKKFLKQWFPETLIVILFKAISNNYLSNRNLAWLNKYIEKATPFIHNPLLFKFVYKRPPAYYDFEVLETGSPASPEQEQETLPEEIEQEEPRPILAIAPEMAPINNNNIIVQPSSPTSRTANTPENPLSAINNPINNHPSWDAISEQPSPNSDQPEVINPEESAVRLGPSRMVLPYYRRNNMISPNTLNSEYFPKL